MSKTKTWETIKNSVGGGGVMVKYFVPNFLNNLWCLGKKKKKKLYVCILYHKYKTYSKKTGKLL